MNQRHMRLIIKLLSKRSTLTKYDKLLFLFTILYYLLFLCYFIGNLYSILSSEMSDGPGDDWENLLDSGKFCSNEII